MENTLRRKNKSLQERITTMFILYAMFTVIVYTLPMLKITLPYMLVALVLIASLVYLIYKNSRWFYYVLFLVLGSLVVGALGMLTGIYGIVDALNEIVRNVRFFTPVLWGCFVIRYCNNEHRKIILAIFGLLCAIIMFQTLNALQEVPDICRELAKSTTNVSADRTSYRMRNVGGFDYCYMIGIVTIAFVWNAVNCESKKVRIISLAATVLGYYFIIQTMYTLLLMLTFAGTIMVFYFTSKKLVVKGGLIIGIILMFFFMEPFLKFLSELFSFNYGLEEKFTNMYLAVKFDDADMMGSRPEMLMAAFRDWVSSPIFGGKHQNSNTHSFLMTVLSGNGIIGFGVWLGAFVYSWKMIRDYLKEEFKHTSLFDIVMVYVFLLAFFNPIGYVFEIVFAAFFIIPTWSMMVKHKNETY